MRSMLVAAVLSLCVSAAAAQDGAAGVNAASRFEQPLLLQVSEDVSEAELAATLTHLVGFGTRHTLSDTRSATRGIGAARRWVQHEFQRIGRACRGCLEIVTPSDTVTGDRIPTPTEIVDVLAIQRGTGDPDRVVIISAHLDSRVSDPMNATADAPGANDDGSGVAAVLEAARTLTKHRLRATVVYAVLSGEEQGLYGGAVLADYAKARNWRVEADLNNDIIGNTHGGSGVVDDTHVRVFSEGTRATETPEQADRRRYNGGEVDSPSRNLARYMELLAGQYLRDFSVRMIYRTDRYGRGGDQVRMLEAGFPAVRVTEAAENYDRQHQDVRTENGVAYGDVISGVDFKYLAQVTRLNVVTLASLAMAPAPPDNVRIAGAVSADTRLRWERSPGAEAYYIAWRATTDPQWPRGGRNSRLVGDVAEATLNGVIIDDWFFGVAAVSADGFMSPMVFPGEAGAFFPSAR
ncbi:MAG TPA: M20/M25/M40 family metallo-hydrolase [Caulobacterales bacterium]|nr:M20/M25/M40 family metallo-hydrolase [Caulobacterales bacterium]